MKILDLAWKDLLRALRSMFALMMMFIAPLLITGLLYMAFGGLGGGEDEAVEITAIPIVLVNEDSGQSAGGFSAGVLVSEFLQNEKFAGFLEVVEQNDWEQVQAQVELGDAGIALRIPADFTHAIITPDLNASVTLYYDPTLNLGPAITRDIVQQFLDSFSASRILSDVVKTEFEAQGQELDDMQLATLMADFGADLAARAEQPTAAYQIMDAQPEKANEGTLEQVMGATMAGMMIFFLFFTGMSAAQSILTEDEEGTLPRLFTTPTSSATILGSKLIYAFLMLVVQAVVLILASQYIFNITWGQPATIAAAVVATILVASGFGLAVMSFVESTRQSGPVFGGVLTISAMLGGLFTTGVPNLPAAWDTVKLFTPHGWALTCWETTLAGASLSQNWSPFLITTLIGAVLFVFGVLRFRRRFA